MIPGLCGHDHEDEQDVAVCRLNRDDSHFERFLKIMHAILLDFKPHCTHNISSVKRMWFYFEAVWRQVTSCSNSRHCTRRRGASLTAFRLPTSTDVVKRFFRYTDECLNSLLWDLLCCCWWFSVILGNRISFKPHGKLPKWVSISRFCVMLEMTAE